MGKKVRRVPYRLEPLKETNLSPDEIRAILRGAKAAWLILNRTARWLFAINNIVCRALIC